MKKLYFNFLLSLITSAAFGQTTFFSYSFEDNGNGTIYNTSVAEFSDIGVSNGFDFFTSTFNNTIGAAYGVTGQDGMHYFAAQDLDGEGGPVNTTLTMDIDITGRSNLGLRILVAEDDFNDPSWDDSDYVHFDYSIDGGLTQNFLWLESEAGAGFNTETRVDTDFDGFGDGIDIPETFTEFEGVLIGTGSTLTLTITFNLNAGSEDIAVDNIRVIEDFSVTPIISVSSGVSGLDYEVGNGPSNEDSFTVSGTNLTNDIVLTVPTNFELSESSGSGFVDTSITLDGSSGTVTETTIYARLKSGLAVNNYVGNVDVTSTGASAKIVSLSGDVTAPLPQLPLTENFDYGGVAGDLLSVSGGKWIKTSGTLPIGYQTTSLSMTGYAASGIGGSITIDDNGGSAEDAYTPFASQSSGSIYASALVNISSFDLTGDDYFMYLNKGASSLYSRLYTKDEGGNLKFGILEHSSGTAAVYAASNYSYNTTYLVVIKYTFSTGTSSVYILDNAAATEPGSPDAVSSDGNDITDLEGVGIRQGNNTPIAVIDGIRVATSWSSAVLSIKDNLSKDFSIYPNPTALGYVNIKSRTYGIMDISVFNILGKQVIKKTINNNRLNVSGLATGVYIMKVSQNDASTTKKLVIK